ncbi:MAG: PilZ domain-containing protein, partial [Candidatus Caldarchaeum sp.]
PEGEGVLHLGMLPLEGYIKPAQQTLIFTLSKHPYTNPPTGLETRLISQNGSAIVLVLQKIDGGIVLAPSPERKERRKSPRVVTPGFAVLEEKDKAHPPLLADIWDVSLEGIGLLTSQPLEEGSRYEMFFRVVGTFLLNGECLAQVVTCRKVERTRGGGWRVGFKFVTLPETLRIQLEQMTLPFQEC